MGLEDFSGHRGGSGRVDIMVAFSYSVYTPGRGAWGSYGPMEVGHSKVSAAVAVGISGGGRSCGGVLWDI